MKVSSKRSNRSESASAIDQLQVGLQSITQSLTRAKMHERLLREAGLRIDRASIIILFKLYRRGGDAMRVSDIAMLVGVDTPAVTRKIQQLEQQGFVNRLADPSDRRAVLIALTAEGRGVVDRILRVHREMLVRLVTEWSETELATFASQLTKFTESLTTEVESYLD